MTERSVGKVKKLKTSELIMKEAFLQFNEKGFEGTSIADISKALGLSKSSMYTHFKDKETLYIAVLQYCTDTWNNLFGGNISKNIADLPPGEKLYFLLAKVVQLSAENKEIVKFWKRAKFFPPAHVIADTSICDDSQEYIQLYKNIFEEGIAMGVFKKINPDDLAKSFSCLVEGIQMSLFFDDDYEKRISIIWKCFWDEISVKDIPLPTNSF